MKTLVGLCLVAMISGCSWFKTESAKLETPADESCMVAALAVDPNIANPVNDFELLGAIYSCALNAIQVDAGPTISQADALKAVARLKPAAQALAARHAAK